MNKQSTDEQSSNLNLTNFVCFVRIKQTIIWSIVVLLATTEPNGVNANNMVPLSLIKSYNSNADVHRDPYGANQNIRSKSSSNCALILRRMIPLNVDRSYAPSFKSMLEALRGVSL